MQILTYMTYLFMTIFDIRITISRDYGNPNFIFINVEALDTMNVRG